VDRVSGTPQPGTQPHPSVEERRTGDRHMAVLQVARLILHDRQALCLVRNMSAGGVMIHSEARIDSNEEVAIELKFAGLVGARVAWRRGIAAGLQFHRPIDVARALGRDRDSDNQPRGPRIEVFADATITVGGEASATSVIDVSQGGAKIVWPGPLVREKVELAIEGLVPRAARMCWADGEHAGIAFNMALPFEMLAGWALARQPRVSLYHLVAAPTGDGSEARD